MFWPWSLDRRENGFESAEGAKMAVPKVGAKVLNLIRKSKNMDPTCAQGDDHGVTLRRCRTTGRKTKAPHRFELMGPKRIILFFTKFGYAEIYSVILGFGGVFFMGRRFFVPMKWQQVDIRNGHNFSL